MLKNSAEKKTHVAKCKGITVAFTPGQYYSGDHGARNTFLGKGGMAHTGFYGETLREETTWKI